MTRFKKNSIEKKLKPREIINKAFRHWYFSLPANNIYTIKAKIIESCELSEFKWNNWRSGKSTPNKYEREIINKIAGTNIFN